MMMRNVFEKPGSLPQWLVSSVCWVGSCWIGFKAISWGMLVLWRDYHSLFLVFGLALIICGLMWQRVISVGWQLLRADKAKRPLLRAVAGLWLSLLGGAFLMTSVGLAYGTMILLALSGESDGAAHADY